MFTLLLSLLCMYVIQVSACASTSLKGIGNVLGGKPAQPGDYPYIMSLELSGLHVCAATAIGDYWALTVAHCVTDVPADNLTLRAGTIVRENNGTVHSIKNIITHHEFVEAELDNDIALIQVAEPFSENQYVKYVVLAAQDEKVPIGTHAVVAGWGKTHRDIEAPSTVLRHASVNVVEMKNCQERVPKPVVTTNMVCGERKGQQSFKGDFGSPLIVRMGDNVKQIGIAAWGDFAEKDSAACFYTDISHYRLWIHRKTQI